MTTSGNSVTSHGSSRNGSSRNGSSRTRKQVKLQCVRDKRTQNTKPQEVICSYSMSQISNQENIQQAIEELNTLLPKLKDFRKNLKNLCDNKFNDSKLYSSFAQYTLMMIGDMIDDAKKNHCTQQSTNKVVTPETEKQLKEEGYQKFCDIISNTIVNDNSTDKDINMLKERVKFVVGTLLPQIRNETIHLMTMDTQFLKVYNEGNKDLEIEEKALETISLNWLRAGSKGNENNEIKDYIHFIIDIVKLDEKLFPDAKRPTKQINRNEASGTDLTFCQTLLNKVNKEDNFIEAQKTYSTDVDDNISRQVDDNLSHQSEKKWIKDLSYFLGHTFLGNVSKNKRERAKEHVQSNFEKINKTGRDISRRDNNAINRADKFTTSLHDFLEVLNTEYNAYQDTAQPKALRHFHFVRFLTTHHELYNILHTTPAQDFLKSSSLTDQGKINPNVTLLGLDQNPDQKIAHRLRQNTYKPIKEGFLPIVPARFIGFRKNLPHILFGDRERRSTDPFIQMLEDLRLNLHNTYNNNIPNDENNPKVVNMKGIYSHGPMNNMNDIKQLFAEENTSVTTSKASKKASKKASNVKRKINGIWQKTVQEPLNIITQRLTQDPLCMMSEDENQRQDNDIQSQITCLQKTVNLLSDLEMRPHRLNAERIKNLFEMLEETIPNEFQVKPEHENFMNKYKTVRSAFYKAFIGEEDPYKASRDVYMDIQNTPNEDLETRAKKFMENSEAINLMSKLFKNLNKLAVHHSTVAINISEHIIILTSLDREYDALASHTAPN